MRKIDIVVPAEEVKELGRIVCENAVYRSVLTMMMNNQLPQETVDKYVSDFIASQTRQEIICQEILMKYKPANETIVRYDVSPVNATLTVWVQDEGDM